MDPSKGSFRLSSIKGATRWRTFLIVVLVLVVTFGSVTVYFIYPFQATNFPRVGEHRAAIVDALSELNPNPAFTNETIRYLAAAGLSADIYTGPQVTVEFMKSFPAGYALVIFRVHSATSRHGVFYFTSEAYDESKYEAEQFRDELRPGKDYEGNPPVFAFGPKFVDTFLRDRFQNAIVVGMGCFGAGISYGTEEEVAIENVEVEKGPNLAEAFYRQGAAAVIGWDSLVTLSFSDQATLRLIDLLAVERLTVRQATARVNLEMGPDPIYKSQLVFYPERNGDKMVAVVGQQAFPPPCGFSCQISSISARSFGLAPTGNPDLIFRALEIPLRLITHDDSSLHSSLVIVSLLRWHNVIVKGHNRT